MMSFESGFASIEVLFVVVVAALGILMTCVVVALRRHLKTRAATSGIAQLAAKESVVHRPLPRGVFDIAEFLRQESESLEARLRSAGMSLEIESLAHPIPVLLDRRSMQELLAHLVDFARSVMFSGSTLQVLARIDGTHAVVNFMDTSVGTDAPRLGKWFADIYASSLRPNHGSDAAAQVARCGKIVGEHHGRIYAAPSPLGSLGITLRLPILRT